jgi:excisionase family DNA binding protein
MRVDTSASNGNYMKVSEVARELGITGLTVRTLVKKGDIKPALRIGGLVLIPRDVFQSYVERSTIQPAQAA